MNYDSVTSNKYADEKENQEDSLMFSEFDSIIPKAYANKEVKKKEMGELMWTMDYIGLYAQLVFFSCSL